MVNPTANWCHPTADLKMFKVTSNDLTIDSAVLGSASASTVVNEALENGSGKVVLVVVSNTSFSVNDKIIFTSSGGEYTDIVSTVVSLVSTGEIHTAHDYGVGDGGSGTVDKLVWGDFDELQADTFNNFVDSGFGTQGVDPNETEEFRGYPKPTVTATFTEFTGASTTPNSLTVECTIANKVGFDIHVDFQNLDVDSTVYEATITAGNRTSGVSPMFTTTGADIIFTMTWYSTTSTVQYTPTLTGDTTGTLVFTAPGESILRDFGVAAVFYDSDLCLTTTTATGYYQEKIWSSSVISIGVTGITLYQGDRASNGGNTTAASKVFRRANLSLGFDKIVTNGSGVITTNVQCSP